MCIYSIVDLNIALRINAIYLNRILLSIHILLSVYSGHIHIITGREPGHSGKFTTATIWGCNSPKSHVLVSSALLLSSLTYSARSGSKYTEEENIDNCEMWTLSTFRLRLLICYSCHCSFRVTDTLPTMPIEGAPSLTSWSTDYQESCVSLPISEWQDNFHNGVAKGINHKISFGRIYLDAYNNI